MKHWVGKKTQKQFNELFFKMEMLAWKTLLNYIQIAKNSSKVLLKAIYMYLMELKILKYLNPMMLRILQMTEF